MYIEDVNNHQSFCNRKYRKICLQLLFNNPTFSPKIEQIEYCSDLIPKNQKIHDPYFRYGNIELYDINHKLEELSFNNQYRYLVKESLSENQLSKEFLAVQYCSGIRYFPSISSNTGFVWTEELLLKCHKFLDFWILALRGNISWQLVVKFSLFFDEVRFIGSSTHDLGSDFGSETHYLFKSGWQNLAENPNFHITEDFMAWSATRKVRKIEAVTDFFSFRSTDKVNLDIFDLINVKDYFYRRYCDEIKKKLLGNSLFLFI
jgi:hypothetical protein